MGHLLPLSDAAHMASMMVNLLGGATTLLMFSSHVDSLVGPSVREVRTICLVGLGLGGLGLLLEVAASISRVLASAP